MQFIYQLILKLLPKKINSNLINNHSSLSFLLIWAFNYKVNMRLEDEIKTQFKSEYHKLVVNIIYTHNFVSKEIVKILKPHSITSQQYNLLRILRGQYPKPANINLLIDRMLDKMSNASRLVEQLREKGLLTRKRNINDRRNVDVIITDAGLRLLQDIDPLIDEFSYSLDYLTEENAKNLNVLMDKLRNPKDKKSIS